MRKISPDGVGTILHAQLDEHTCDDYQNSWNTLAGRLTKDCDQKLRTDCIGVMFEG